jgi:hypothetical protein
MKTQVAILISISLLLFSCAPATPTQEDEVVEIATEEVVIEAPTTQEPITTEEPIVTEEATETPIACVTLLTPTNGVEIPPVGKVTFSWTAIDEAGKYILNIILPSGDIVLFETDQTFYEQYMEAFSSGGEYQWRVIAQGNDGSEICVSEVAIFDKPTYESPKQPEGGNNGSNDNGSSGGNDSGGGEVPCEDTPEGCSGTN